MPPRMFIEQAVRNPGYFVTVLVTVVVSITLHELAHGLTALRHGDHTPRALGHMTLNPAVHMPPMAFLALLLAGIAWGSMPINPARLRGRYAEAKVALAGPMTNLGLALLALTAVGLWQRYTDDPEPARPVRNAWLFLRVFGTTNLALFAFNLLPVPPLDGSHILANLSPGYRRFASDPNRQGIAVGLFVGAFLLSGYLFGYLNRAAMAFVSWVNGGNWVWF